MQAYKLYKTQRNGSDFASLIADCGNVTGVGDLKWTPENRAKFEALEPGSCSVTDGWRVTRLADFKQGSVMFDSHAKEYVKISNGKCVLRHDSPAAFAADHPEKCECTFAPSEAYALRAIVHRDGTVGVAWTYRAVNPVNLEPMTKNQQAEVDIQFAIALNPEGIDKKLQKTFVGRY